MIDSMAAVAACLRAVDAGRRGLKGDSATGTDPFRTWRTGAAERGQAAAGVVESLILGPSLKRRRRKADPFLRSQMAVGTDAPPSPTAPHLRQTSALTTRLILAYLEANGGRGAVLRALEGAGMADREADLRDENGWFSFAEKIRLLEAAGEAMEDPDIARHVGEQAIDLDIGQGLKIALQALGSPRMVYANIVRACSKFTTTHQMEIVELSRERARVRYTDVSGTGTHALDCDLNIGLLSCAPRLFGRPPARVAHPECALQGADACVYDVRWDGGGSHHRRSLAALALGAGGLLAAFLAAPGLVPEAGAAMGAAMLAGLRVEVLARRGRWRELEAKVRQQAEAAERLSSSLHDLVSELRLEELLDKITRHAQSAVGGKDFALLVTEEDGIRCRSTSGLSEEAAAALERWAAATPSLVEAPVLRDDLSAVPSLAALPEQEVPIRALCTAPLRFRGRSLGVLVALSPSERAFLPYDTELLSTYAAQAAIALANARLYEAQQALASRDPLTGLLNHREFHEAVARELERCRRHGRTVSVVVFDLDGFKLVNDTAGHAEGDRVLRVAAQALGATARAGDLACRIGGDELALVLPETGAEEARRVAARVREAVGATDARTGASYGVASWPEDGPTKDTLLQRADADLYVMKRGRREAGTARRTPAQRGRLATASRLSALLAPLTDAQEIVEVTVAELHRSFGFYVAGLQRLDPDGMLRLAAVQGELAQRVPDLAEAWTQSVDEGVSGRVVRLGEPVLIADTHDDPDFLSPPRESSARSALTVPVRVDGEVWGVLDLEALEPRAFDADDLLLGVMVAAQVGAALHRSLLAEERERTFETTLAVLGDALESKDSYTAAHAREVAELCEGVGIRLGLASEPRRALRYAALLHDIGKIGVRTEILIKPGALTDAEFAEIKRHTVIGAEMLGRIPGFEAVQVLVRWAHERWDGSGYPDGLAGEDIPLGARIICACDAYHAMTSDRPYRRAMPAAAALAELRRCAGTHFDPTVVEALLAQLAPLARAA